MSTMKMTLIGAYNYNPTLFDNVNFPEGIDKDLAVNEILTRAGEFELIYSDLDFLKFQITKWASKHYRTFDKWINALNIEFDPLYNYDRYEEITDKTENSGSVSSNAGATTTGKVSAYDSSSYQPKDETSTSSESGETSGSESNYSHKAHLYGNIGVTTSSELLESYLQVERFNIYEQMADIFVDEFCLLIY